MLKTNLDGTTQPQEKSIIDNQLFNAIFNDSPDAIFILDAGNYRIIECNNRALKLFEAGSKEELKDLSYLKLYASEPIEIDQSFITSELKEKGTYTQELSFRTLKKNIFWGKLTNRTLVLDDQKVTVLRVTKTVDYLRTGEALAALLKGTSKVTGKLFLKELTKLLCRTFDTRYAFIGKIQGNDRHKLDIIQIWEENDESESFQINIKGSCTENVLKGYTSYYPYKMGEMFPSDKMVQEKKIVSLLGTPIFSTSGNAVGILAVMDDKPMNEIPNARYILSIFASRAAAEIQRVKSREILREQTKKISIANQVKDKFLSVVAHDLKNPMQTILGFSELLRNKTGEYSKEQLTKRIEIIDNSIRNLYCMLENLIDWSRLQRDVHELSIEEISLREIVEENIGLFQYIIDVKSLKIINNIPQELLVRADKYCTNSIIRNILSNAIIYSYKKGSIKLSVSEDSSRYTIAVADEGVGVGEKEQKNILASNTGFNENSSGENGGSGLGLVISKTFIEKQGGKIWFESIEGKGSTFYFTILK
jgi:PAS domain S-box-containing protein